MEDEEQKMKRFYEQNLKAADYLVQMRKCWNETPELFRFHATFMRNVFNSGRFKGSKLLEIGSGVCVHNVAAASAHFPSITLCDYVPDNVENLKLWLQGKSDLQQMLDVHAELEGFEGDLEAGKRVLESRIRASVKRVARCDVLSDQVLMDASGDPETSPPFDVLVSCLCFETAVKDYGSYCRLMERVGRLLRKGGGLVTAGFLQGSPWVVGGHAFPHIKLDERQLVDAVEKAGFGKVDFQTISGEDYEDGSFSYDKLFCLAAEKL